MVVFTCNNCGDSVKKPKVEKHVSIECKRKFSPVSLCCVDCLKDFNANTFVEHTKCVTELERYSAKGFVPKPSSNKGERKQNSWMDIVRSVLNLPALTRQQRELLQAITHFDNVPRKKAKFQNFVKSSIRHIKVFPDVADSVFDLLEKTFKETTTTPVVTHTDTNGAASSNSINQENGSTNEVENSEETIRISNNINSECNADQSRKVKKNKHNSNKTTDKFVPITVESDCHEQAPHSTEHEFEIVKRKKKKKKNKIEDLKDSESASVHVVDDGNNGVSTANIETDYECSVAANTAAIFDDSSFDHKQISKKKRKKLRLPLDTSIAISLAHDDNGSGSETVSVVPESAEKTTNDVTANDTHKHSRHLITDTVTEDGSDDRKPKKKKRGRKHADAAHESDVDLRVAAKSEKNGENELGGQRKRKRKLMPTDDETSVSTSKKTKMIQNMDAYGNENDFNGCNKFVWEDVIKSLLSKSNDEGVSLKRMTKKIVNEYQRSFPNRSYDEIAKKLNKKMSKLPFVIVYKERVRLRA